MRKKVEKIYISQRIRMTTICICETKGADNRLCFHYTGSMIPRLPTSQL